MLALKNSTYLLYGIITDIKECQYHNAHKKLVEFMATLEDYPNFRNLKAYPIDLEMIDLAGIILGSYLYLCENYSDELMEKVIRQVKTLDNKLCRNLHFTEYDDLESIAKGMIQAIKFITTYSEYPFEVEFDSEYNVFHVWTIDSDEVRFENDLRFVAKPMENPELSAEEAIRLVIELAAEAIKTEVRYLL